MKKDLKMRPEHWLFTIRLRLRSLFRWAQADQELDDELCDHLERKTEEYMALGMAPEEARRRVRLDLGGIEQTKEKCRDERRVSVVEDLLQDLRYAVRGIIHAPFLSFAVLVTLVAGVGLNAAVFTLIDSAWFQAPVQKHPGSFVQAIPSYSGRFDTENQFHGFTVRDYEAIRTRAKSLRDVAGFNRAGRVKLEESAEARVGLVTCDFFKVYGWEPVLGRLFLPQECSTPGPAQVVVISEALWRNLYGAEQSIAGKIIHINRQPYTVVGVVRSQSALLMGDLWIPYITQPQFYRGYDGFREHPDYPWLSVFGRLKPGYSQAGAQAELNLIQSQQDALVPGRKTTIQLTNGSLFQSPEARQLGFVVVPLTMGPMVLILLVACTNVTMLLLSRAAARRSEVAIRLALGAGRGRLLRMLATEGLVLAAVAGVVSVYFAYKLPGVVWALLLRRNWYYAPGPDWMVFAYLAGVTLVAGCMAGLAPARETLKVDVLPSLQGQMGTATARSRARSFLIVAQLAMSFVLVAAGVLYARLQHSASSMNPGFETRQVLAVPLQVPESRNTPELAAGFYRAAQERVRELPSVRSASYTTVPPFAGAAAEEIRLPGEGRGQGRAAVVEQVSTDFFSTLGIAIVRGRAFQDSAATGNTAVAIVSQAFAAAFWNQQNPLGKVVLLPDNTQFTVIGVAGDLQSTGFDVPDGPRLYVTQNPQAPLGTLMVRFDGDAGSLAAAIGRTINALDNLQLVSPRTLQSMMEETAERIRPLTGIILLMAVLTLLLAVTGIYGTVAFSMSQRVREIGIRTALGATKGIILRAVLASGVRQIAVGLAVGLLLALPAAFAFRLLLRSSSVFDWSTYAIAALALTLAALCAYYVPARRATRVDPMVALRYE